MRRNRDAGQPADLRSLRQLAYLKLGEKRGKRRLWIEGGRLSRAGFLPGTRFRLSSDPGSKTLTIQIDEQGEHRVSRRKRRNDAAEIPIIDINNETLNELFNRSVERVCVVVTRHSLIIGIHPDDEAAAERYARLVAKLARREPLAIGSVAHGGGVLDHAMHTGLAQGGVETRLAYAVEVEHKYLEASLRNNEIWDDRSIPVHAPMEEVQPELLPKIDLYVGGIPCTGASRSGKAKNRLRHAEDHESAGALFVAFLALLKAGNPSVVVLENVPDYQNTASMSVIRATLEHLKYRVHETVLDGNALGALEDRKRFCMVAVTEGLEFDWSRLRAVRRKEDRLGEVLEAIEDDAGCWRTYSYLDEKEKRDRKSGKGFRRQIVTPESAKVGTIGRGYSKARSTEPFLAHPTDPGRSRLLTPREHARVKTIPEHLVDGLSPTTAHEILGQSVIHSAFVAVGKLIGECLRESVFHEPERRAPERAERDTTQEPQGMDDNTLELGF